MEYLVNEIRREERQLEEVWTKIENGDESEKLLSEFGDRTKMLKTFNKVAKELESHLDGFISTGIPFLY